MDKTKLGDRMKGYESVTRGKLMGKMPYIIRVDGKSFSKLTKDLDKPYCRDLARVMQYTARGMCENIQGAKFAYVQSDEISVVCTDFESYETQQWFGGNLLKIVSVSAALASTLFNYWAQEVMGHNFMALFDSRAFNVSVMEVVNYFIWRQKDAIRNSISGLAQAYYSHKHMHGKNQMQLHDMLKKDHNVDWFSCSISQKRGAGVVRLDNDWQVDLEIPEFTQDRAYVFNQMRLKEGDL